jgi:hypothetical protein
MASTQLSEKYKLDSARQTFRWLRTAAIGFSILFTLVAVQACVIIFSTHQAVDFLSFWAAGHLVVLGRAASAYNVMDHRILELMIAPIKGVLPFPYPPPFLLLVTPFGMMSYWAAFATWVALTYAGFVASSALIGGRNRLPFALSHPGVMTGFMTGQNGFLTSSIFMFGTSLLKRAPFFGGATLGLLIIKPQLALALPFALIAGREWKAILGGIVSSLGALLLAWAVFGTSVYKGFFEILPTYTQAIDASKWPWNELASPFASLRFIGVSQGAALAVHGVIALLAIVIVCRAWWLKVDERVAILACGTMLVPPYLFTYDSLVLVIPMLSLANGRRPVWIVLAVWVLCMLPVATYFRWYPGPNTIPLASLLCLWALRKGALGQPAGALALSPVGHPSQP